MKIYNIFLPLIIFALLACSPARGQDSKASELMRRSSLPENPCDVLSQAQVSALTGLEITSVKRAPSIEDIVRAQKEGRGPGPGVICIYETRSDFGEIMLAVQPRADRRAAKYWESRAKYFKTYPRSALPVAALGADAWLSGGSTLHVLIDGDEYFVLSTQLYDRQSGALLGRIARAVLIQH